MNEISCNIEADPVSWVERVERVCRLIEGRYGIVLSKAHSGTKYAATTKLISDRRKYLKSRLKTVNRWFCFFTGGGYKPTESGFKNVDYFAVGGTMNPDGSYGLTIVLPDDCAEVMELRTELESALGKAQQAVQPDRREDAAPG